jgi:signal transduction histidine kinase/CheY-like chemotaxis protein
MTDITMQESLVDGHVRLLEMVALGKPLGQVLDSILRFCEARSPEMLSSILLLDPDGIHVRHGAAPSLPAEYMRAIDGLPIGPCAGSCGTAAYRKEPVIVEDIETDPLWAPYRPMVTQFRLRACWSTPIFDPERRVLGTFAIYYRKPGLPAEEHLRLIAIVTHLAGIAIASRRADEDKRRVFERISDAFVALDAEWRYTYVNRKAGELLERDPESLIGKHVWTEFPQGPGRKARIHFERAMAEQIPITFEEYSPPTGKWFENRIYPSPQGLSIYFCDITGRRRAEDRLRQNEKLAAIGQLAGGIAHDFNNQLSIMLGYAGLLESRVTDPDQKRYASSIVRAANRSGDLTRNLLMFSHQGHFETVPIDIHEMIGEIAEILGRSIDKRITIVRNLRAEDAVVKGEPGTLQNALLNLALNARDAMPEGGILAFSTDRVELPMAAGADDRRQSPAATQDLAPGSYLHIAVKDTGTGMSEAVQDRIFEPFFTTKPVGKGTGLGLVSVFGTVKSHKGGIEVESLDGNGTTFHLYLPFAGKTFPGKTVSKARSVPVRGLGIMVVDDEGPIRDMIAEMLRGDGNEVSVASGGREALEIYRVHWRGIDLIVLDLVMADIDGYQAFYEIRKINPDAKVLLSSGYSPEGKIKSLLRDGALGLLQKPYEKSQMDRMIADAMG